MTEPPLLLFHLDFNFVSLRDDYIRRWLENLAEFGYTGIVWELEDKVRWSTCPECVWPEAMTKQQFRGILEHSRSLGLDNIPLLQTIGHAEYVLSRQEYSAWRENPDSPDCYCTSKPEVRHFLSHWIEEYVELFDGNLRHFHLGGDEAYHFASCPDCQPQAEERGRNQLYAEHILELAEPLLARGIRPGIWCDMVLRHPEDIEVIPPEFVIWDWNYWDSHEPTDTARLWGQGTVKCKDIPEKTLKLIPELLDDDKRCRPFYTADFLQRQGRDVILCSASRSHGDSIYVGNHDVHGPNIYGAGKKTREANLLGHLVTSWAIRIHNFETQAPWLAMAGHVHNHPDDDFATACLAATTSLFGKELPDFFSALAKIDTPLPFASKQETGIQFNGLKQPIPPPGGYTAWMIEEWRGSNDGNEARRETLFAASPAIREGLSELLAMVEEVSQGLPVLDALSRAAWLQLWHARMGQAAFQKAEGEEIPHRVADIASHMCAVYASWAGTWMTPQCAKHTAKLVLGPLVDYLSS